MTSIGSVTPTSSNTAGKDSRNLITNYETFLNILTTQLRHQNPLEPMDSTKFTEQLTQFSTVEQQIKTNKQLENLSAMVTASNALGALGMVGKTVTIDGSKGQLSSQGTVNYKFNASEAGTAEITIRNAKGQIVAFKKDVAISPGDQAYKWNGLDAAGNRLANGTYSIQVTAKNSSGKSITIQNDTSGKVDKVDVTSSTPILVVNGQHIQMSQIKSVS